MVNQIKFYTFANNRDRENCFLSLNAFQKRGRIIFSVAEFSAGWPETSAKSWQHCFSQVPAGGRGHCDLLWFDFQLPLRGRSISIRKLVVVSVKRINFFFLFNLLLNCLTYRTSTYIGDMSEMMKILENPVGALQVLLL